MGTLANPKYKQQLNSHHIIPQWAWATLLTNKVILVIKWKR